MGGGGTQHAQVSIVALFSGDRHQSLESVARSKARPKTPGRNKQPGTEHDGGSGRGSQSVPFHSLSAICGNLDLLCRSDLSFGFGRFYPHNVRFSWAFFSLLGSSSERLRRLFYAGKVLITLKVDYFHSVTKNFDP